MPLRKPSCQFFQMLTMPVLWITVDQLVSTAKKVFPQSVSVSAIVLVFNHMITLTAETNSQFLTSFAIFFCYFCGYYVYH